MSRCRPAQISAALAVLSLAAVTVSLASGAVPVPWAGLLSGEDSIGSRVLWQIRIPRTLFGFICGGALGICGAALQGLFRNALADPALVGVSGGAALGAVAGILLGGIVPAFAMWLLPGGAFLGAVGATGLVLSIASRIGSIEVSRLLLAGIAVNALAGAGIGWMVYGATDSQLRDFTFWSMGSLAGIGWNALLISAPLIALSSAVLMMCSRSLNALCLGEADAWLLGAPIEKVKLGVLGATALAVGVGTSFSGMIAFIGLIAPHLVRFFCGADHRHLLPSSFLTGGCLLAVADIVARIARQPAEIPVGVVVSSLGAPFFVALLLRRGGRL